MLKPGLYLVVNVFKPTATKSFQLLSLICRERERQEMNPALASSRGDLPAHRRSVGAAATGEPQIFRMGFRR